MPQTNSIKIQTLKQQIITSRERLQTIWDTHGCTDSEVLAAGIELDELMNEYQLIVIGERRKVPFIVQSFNAQPFPFKGYGCLDLQSQPVGNPRVSEVLNRQSIT